MSLTEKGTLDEGALVGGVRHAAFELRSPTLQDNIDAVDEVGSHNPVAINAAVLARQLVRLGTLEPKQITFELLCSLHPADYNILDRAAAELEKKRKATLQPPPTSSESGSPSSAPA